MKKLLIVAIIFLSIRAHAQIWPTANATQMRYTATSTCTPSPQDSTVFWMFNRGDSSLYRWTKTNPQWVKYSTAGTSFYQTIQSNTSSQTQRANLNFSSQFTVADNSGNGSTDISLTSVTTQSAGDNSTKPASTAYADASAAAANTAYYASTTDANVANTTTATSIVGTGTGTLTFPANFFTVGKVIKIKILGTSGTDPTNPNLAINMSFGGTGGLLAAFAEANLPSTALYSIELTGVCRSTGSSGSIYFMESAYQNGKYYSGTVGTWTYNTTASSTLAITATWTTASASNTLSNKILLVETK